MTRDTSLITRATALGCSLFAATAIMLASASARAQEAEVPARPEPAQRYDDALQALMSQRYAAAYGRFAALADEGHAQAALMALAMVRYRPTMVGSEWSASPAQLRQWSDLATQRLQQSVTLLAERDSAE